MRTPNWFFTSRRFVSAIAWKASPGGFVLWPSVWVEWGREPSLELRVHRITAGLARWRCQVDLGHWTPIDTDGPIDWERLGIDGYLAWAKRTFGRQWGRLDVERLFRQDPAWRRLALLGTAHNHYVRVVLARAMLSAQDCASTGHTPVGQALPPSDPSDVQTVWSKGPTETGDVPPHTLLEGLERLGENLRRRDCDSEG